MAVFSAKFDSYGSTPAQSTRAETPPSTSTRRRAAVPDVLPMEGVEDEAWLARRIAKEEEEMRARMEEFAEHRDKIRWEKMKARASSSRDHDGEDIFAQAAPPRDDARSDIAREQYVRAEQFARSAEAKRDATHGVREKEVEAEIDAASNAAEPQQRFTPGKARARQAEREALAHAQLLAEALEDYRLKFMANAEKVTAQRPDPLASLPDYLSRSSTNPPRKPFGYRDPNGYQAAKAFGYDSSQWGKAAAQSQARAKAANEAKKQRAAQYDTKSFAQATEAIRKQSQAHREEEAFDDADRTHDYEQFKARREAIEQAEAVKRAKAAEELHRRHRAEEEAKRKAKEEQEAIRQRHRNRQEARVKAEQQTKINAQVAAAKLEAERLQREREFVERLAKENEARIAEQERIRLATEDFNRLRAEENARLAAERNQQRQAAQAAEKERIDRETREAKEKLFRLIEENRRRAAAAAERERQEKQEARQRLFEAQERAKQESDRRRQERARNAPPPPRPGPSRPRPPTPPRREERDRYDYRRPPSPNPFPFPDWFKKTRNLGDGSNNENPRVGDVQAAWTAYESRWAALTNLPATPAWTFGTIPWPVTYPISGPGELLPLAVRRFLLATCHSEGKNKKQRVREALLRWHPDKFLPKFLGNVREADREAVKECVNAIVNQLQQIE